MMTDEYSGFGGQSSGNDDLVEIDLNFESMRRFQAEFSPNLSKDGLFIDTGEPLDPGSVVRFRVILPEDFVFLEGTAVVEWRRSAEAISDGPPGMALRFVTLSPQNEELVEQLVQDHIDAGGTPFDLVARPSLDDFPTDALEGAPVEPEQPTTEGYRLTVRGTGPSLESEALQALQDAVPGAAETEPLLAEDEDEVAVAADGRLDFGEDAGESVEAVAAAAVSDDEATLDQPAEAEPVTEPPEIDWSAMEDAAREAKTAPPAADGAELDADLALMEAITAPMAAEPEIGSDELPADELPADELVVGVESAPAETFEAAPAVEPEEAEPEAPSQPADYDSSITDVLEVPEEFASGPEVIDEIEEDFGSRAFEVSLPEADDGPDTTPVMPDEGGADVTVTTDDGMASPPRRRRLWPLGLGIVLVLAVAAGFLRPSVKTWLESRGDATPPSDAATVSESVAPQPGAEPPSEAEPAAVAISEVEGEGPSAADAPSMDEQGSPEPVVEAAEPDPVPEPAPEAVPSARADAIESIEIEAGSGGTVVRIRGNGALGDGAVSMENLSSPPRVLVRLRGIRSVFRPFTIEAATAEVTQARIGHHDDRRPPELWVVLDLTGPGAEIGGIDIRGERADFVITRP
ncbi:MAG: PilZ domain-containing protein [Candidatus Sulfomarinibacteraceae bacterium]